MDLVLRVNHREHKLFPTINSDDDSEFFKDSQELDLVERRSPVIRGTKQRMSVKPTLMEALVPLTPKIQLNNVTTRKQPLKSCIAL